MSISKGTLSVFLYEVNVMVDQGEKESIDIVNQKMQNGAIVEYIAEKYKGKIDLSLLIDHPNGKQLNKMLQDFSNAHAGNERRKWGITNNGLCLLVSWTAELIRDLEHYI